MADRIHITWDVLAAVLLLLAGLVLLSERLDIPGFRELIAWWPAALIALGVAKLYEAAEGTRPRS